MPKTPTRRKRLNPQKIFLSHLGKHCPSPDFPKEARRAKIQSASVLLDVTVTEEGTAKDIRVIRDPGDGFRDKAVEAVQKWKFKPAKDKDGHPVAARVNIEVVFRSPD